MVQVIIVHWVVQFKKKRPVYTREMLQAIRAVIKGKLTSSPNMNRPLLFRAPQNERSGDVLSTNTTNFKKLPAFIILLGTIQLTSLSIRPRTQHGIIYKFHVDKMRKNYLFKKIITST